MSRAPRRVTVEISRLVTGKTSAEMAGHAASMIMRREHPIDQPKMGRGAWQALDRHRQQAGRGSNGFWRLPSPHEGDMPGDAVPQATLWAGSCYR